MLKAVRDNIIIRYEVQPIPLVAVLAFGVWTTLVNLMIWCLS
jgi:hypothetical protein